ncbi:hypothetical protein V8D89_003691 [Ganoderma adspersum]
MDPLRNIPHFSELSGHLLRLSTTDRGIFSRLTSVSDILEWTKTKADEYHKVSFVLLAIHNLAAAPIHRFPTEVLELVFSHCWNDRKGLRLSHVCSLWRSIILGRPALWADAVTNWGPLVDKRQAVYDELPFIDALFSRSARHSRGIKPLFHSFSPRIVQSLTPYIGNVTSMRVALNNPSDLYDGLWPTLCSGMPKLDTLQIEFVRRVADSRDADYEGSKYDDPEDPLGWRLDEEVGGPLVVLPRQKLPKLSRLTCPISLVRLFGSVPLKHVKIAAGTVQNMILHPSLDTPGRHLRPYRDCLETLELVGEVMYNVERPACVETLQFPSLRDLRITSSNEKFICAILSWIAFPQTTRIHITDDDDDLHSPKPFEQFFSTRNNTPSPLHPVITTVDRVAIRCSSMRLFESDTMQCFAGDEERLRLEHYYINPEGLVGVFRMNASITHLQLSLYEDPYFIRLQFDFRAFPHLVNLEMDGPKLESLARMLGPTEKPKTRAKAKGRAAKRMPARCPSLAELVITCGLTVQLAAAAQKPKPKTVRSTRSASKIEPSTNVDEVFREKGAILQQVLALRASSGTRLTSLKLRLRPPTVFEHGSSDGGYINLMNRVPVKTDPVWPSPAARQAVLESLDKLVDDPVILKLLDEAGHEINVEEDEA